MMLYSNLLGLTGLAGLALSVPIAEDNTAIVDLTTSLVFNTTLQDFSDWRNEGTGSLASLVNTEGCPMVPGPLGQNFQNACHRRDFALATYWRQGRLTKDNKRQIQLKFRQDLTLPCRDQSCASAAKTYYHTVQAYGTDRATKMLARYSTEPKAPAFDDKLISCDVAKRAFLEGTATNQDHYKTLHQCDTLEQIMNHRVMARTDSLPIQEPANDTQIDVPIRPAVQDEAGALLDALRMACPRFANLIMTEPTDRYWNQETMEILDQCSKLGFTHYDFRISKRGGGQTICLNGHIGAEQAPFHHHHHHEHWKRGDMTGSDSDFEACATSLGSVDSGFDDDIWEVEYLEPAWKPILNEIIATHDLAVKEEANESSKNGTAETIGHKRHRRNGGNPQCQDNEHSAWRKRGDMTGSDSDFEPCGTSLYSVESFELSTWEVERVNKSLSTTTPNEQRTVLALRSLLTEPAQGHNPHGPETREKLLKKYCATLQYDVEVWGNGVDDGIGDDHEEEHIMMTTCRILGYCNEHDGRAQGSQDSDSEYDSAIYTTTEEACPTLEACENMHGSDYYTTIDENLYEYEQQHKTKYWQRNDDEVMDHEEVKAYVEKMLFNVTVNEFMDTEFWNGPDSWNPDDVYPGCANVTAPSHGWGKHKWNWHDACVRHEFGYTYWTMLASTNNSLANQEKKVKERINAVFLQDLEDACSTTTILTTEPDLEREWPSVGACVLLEPYYYKLVTELGANVAALLFDRPEQEVMKTLLENNGLISDWKTAIYDSDRLPEISN